MMPSSFAQPGLSMFPYFCAHGLMLQTSAEAHNGSVSFSVLGLLVENAHPLPSVPNFAFARHCNGSASLESRVYSI